MFERHWPWYFALLTGLFSAGLLAVLAALGWGFTNDISSAKCTPNLTCAGGTCFVVWMPWTDPPCELQRACVSFLTMGGMGGPFKECVWSKNANQWCYSGHDQPPPPIVATCFGQYWFCNCRDQIHGDCDGTNNPSGNPPGICNCMSFQGTPGTHGVTNLCS
ncbi:MAG: hypothetical protein K6T86_19000 [Pirellulales bacterium]|nr:hypothetical protein [Pirellulales bacterium]